MGRTLEVFLDPVLVYALGQNYDAALNVPRDDDLSGGDSQGSRNLLDLGEEASEPNIAFGRTDPLQPVTQGSP